jgi:hypothetical protein
MIAVELTEPGVEGIKHPNEIVVRSVFREVKPWRVVTVMRNRRATPDSPGSRSQAPK